MPSNVGSINVSSGLPIFDAVGAVAIVQAAQLELADSLQDNVASSIAQMSDLAAKLRSAPTLAARLQAQKPPEGRTIAVLGDNLDEANAISSDLIGLGLSVDAPVRVPVMRYDEKTQQLELLWMSAEERQALSALPKYSETSPINWDFASNANPDVDVLRSWSDSPPPADTDRRVDGNYLYICFDNQVNRPVSNDDIDRLLGAVPAAIDRCTAQLNRFTISAEADIDKLKGVISEANESADKSHREAHARALQRAKDGRVDDRAAELRREDARADDKSLRDRRVPR